MKLKIVLAIHIRSEISLHRFKYNIKIYLIMNKSNRQLIFIFLLKRLIRDLYIIEQIDYLLKNRRHF